MKVNTLQLMMLVANLPVSNVFEQMVIGKQLLNSNEVSTQINLLEDALQRDRNWKAAIPEDNPHLYEAINEFLEIAHQNYGRLLFNYTESVHIAEDIISKHNLPELIEINGTYSLAFAIVLITQIDNLPGYSYPMVVKFFRQSNPEMPELMMGTIFCRRYSENVAKAAFEFRDWWKNKKNNFFHHEIVNKFHKLRKKYNLPDFFAA